MHQLYTVNIIHGLGNVESKLFVATSEGHAYDQAITYITKHYGDWYAWMCVQKVTPQPTYIEGYKIFVEKVES